MDNNNSSIKKKLTLGRRKIEIKRIEKKSSLQVTFTKRRMGLFKKASELSILCGSKIAILVQSPANKMFAFGNPDVESVIRHFQSGLTFSPNHHESDMGNYNISSTAGINVGRDDLVVKAKYADAVRRLDVEKKMEKRMKEINEGKFWWEDESFESMELQELEGYLEALEGLRNNVLIRMGELENLMMAPIPNSFGELPLQDQGFNNFVEDFNEEIWWR